MYFCKNCGSVVNSDDIFCTNCACRLDETGMIVDKRGMSSIIAGEKTEFNAEAVCTETDYTGFRVMNFLLSQKIYSFGDSTYYDAVSSANGGTSGIIRHICLSGCTDRDVYSLLHKMNDVRAEKICEIYSEKIKNLVFSFREKCSLSDAAMLNNDAEVFHSFLYRSHHIFILMVSAMPLVFYAKNHVLTVRDVIEIGLKISENILKLKSESFYYGSFSELSVYISENKTVYLDFPSLLARAEFFPFSSISQYEKMFVSPNGKNPEAYSLAMVLYQLLSGFGNPYINPYSGEITEDDLKSAEEKRLSGAAGIVPETCDNMLGEKLVETLNVREHNVTIEELHSILQSSLNYISQSGLDRKIK